MELDVPSTGIPIKVVILVEHNSPALHGIIAKKARGVKSWLEV